MDCPRTVSLVPSLETDVTRRRQAQMIGGETSPGEHFDCEEVGTGQHGHMGGDEILRGGILAPLRKVVAGWIPYRRSMLPTI
jgi:hypothetical protein